MSYKPFTTEYTWQIIDDIKEYLEETNKDQTTLDTLDLSHLIGEIERLNNIINKLNYGIKELDDMFYETFRISQNGYYSISEWELKEFTDKIQELKGEDKE